MAGNLIYEVECELDPDAVADFDAWLPGHVRQVLACAGFIEAAIELSESSPGDRPRRRVRYRLESAAALDRYLENDATRLRAEAVQRFGAKAQFARRVFRPLDRLKPPDRDPRCLNCGIAIAGKHCAQCGQAADAHVLSMREVAGDVAHSLLHLDSRVWRTLRLLVRRPGELTREFIAGRHQRFLPPFRLYLAISLLYFALSAILPGPGPFGEAPDGGTVVAPAELERELAAEGLSRAQIDEAMEGREYCALDIGDSPAANRFEDSLNRACEQIRADGGKRFAERFAATAPKLMFVFLPLMAAVALIFYRRPRRLYTEHLVLFLHNHAFTFLLLGATDILGAIGGAAAPTAPVMELVSTLLFLYLAWYVFRSMRVVYAEGRRRTALKFVALAAVYFILLGVTMLAGLVYAMLELA